MSTKETAEILRGIKSVGQFEDIAILKILRFPTHEHGMLLYSLKSSLNSFNNVL